MSNSNLLKETVKFLEARDKVPSDVRWVGSEDGSYSISWDEFTKIADIEYDKGFGSQEIATDLVIVGDDWWLAREEYDGSEGWAFLTLPRSQSTATKFARVKNHWYQTVHDMNLPESSEWESHD